MRFQKKILLNYVAFLMISAVVICALYFTSAWKRYVSEEYAYLQTLASQMVQQMELQYSSMQEVTESLLSDADLLEDLKILSAVRTENDYRREAKASVNIKLNTYHIVKNYYRVLIYNEFGDIFASYNFDERKVVSSIPDEQKPWIHQTMGRKGKIVFIPPHQDLWSLRQPRRVYGLMRQVLGYQTYVEVQQTEESLNRIFHIHDDNIQTLVMSETGDIIYENPDREDMESYRHMGPGQNTRVFQAQNPSTGKYQIVAAAYSDLAGVTVLLIEDRSVVFQKMSGPLWIAFSALFVFVAIFAYFLYHVSKNMAQPINELRRQMEHASFDSLKETIHIENSIDEIKALANTYERMTERLKESLIKEKNLSYLQLQARYDLLQAQINPHFFHNVLNVVSSRGLSLGDETICEICESLSGMLRYATGNRTRYAAIEDEIGYLLQYLYLMKLRYRHKIEYHVEVEDSIQKQTVPKIVFQQIVENSIKHGFNGSGKVMKISVVGRFVREGRKWEMSFLDNGEGIREDMVKELETKMAVMRENLKSQHKSIEMEIGGMGLLNTYARMFLFFGEEMEFSISGSSQGTRVIIRAPLSDSFNPCE